LEFVPRIYVWQHRCVPEQRSSGVVTTPRGAAGSVGTDTARSPLDPEEPGASADADVATDQRDNAPQEGSEK
jgi:hypothetical protein